MSKKLLKNTLIYGLGGIAQRGLSFVIVFLYARYLVPSDIGVLNTLQIFSAIYTLFLSFGLERSLYRLYHDYTDEAPKKQLLGTIYISIFGIAFFVFVSTFLFKEGLSGLVNNIAFYPFIILAMFDALNTALTVVPKILFQVEEKPMRFLLLSVGQPVVTLFCIFMALSFGKDDVATILKVTLLSYGLFLPVNLYAVIKRVQFVFKVSIFKTIMSFSLPLLPALLSTWVVNMSDRLFIGRFYDMEEVGIYSVVYKVAQIVQLFAGALLMAYSPTFFVLANKEIVDESGIHRMHNQSILISLFVSGFVALVCNDLLKIFFDAQYYSAAYIAPIVVLGYFFVQMTGFQNVAFTQNKKTTLLMLLNISGAGANILLNYFLIQYYGMFGAAIATVITQVVLFGLTYIFSLNFYFLRTNFYTVIPVLFLFIALTIIMYSYVEAGWTSLFLKLVLSVVVIFAFFRKNIIELLQKRSVL